MSIAHDGRYGFENAYASPAAAWPPAPNSKRSLPFLLSFHGRATRGQFWAVSILNNLAYFAVLMLAAERLREINHPLVQTGILVTCLVLFMWVNLAIQVKRCHDRDKSGFWVLVGFIPIVGPLWRIIELGCLSGTPGENQYGPGPLNTDATDEHQDRRLKQPRRATPTEDQLSCFALSAESQPEVNSAPTAEPRWM